MPAPAGLPRSQGTKTPPPLRTKIGPLACAHHSRSLWGGVFLRARHHCSPPEPYKKLPTHSFSGGGSGGGGAPRKQGAPHTLSPRAFSGGRASGGSHFALSLNSPTRCPEKMQGYLAQETPPPRVHHRSLDIPTVGSEEGVVSYERGTPVPSYSPLPHPHARNELKTWLPVLITQSTGVPRS